MLHTLGLFLNFLPTSNRDARRLVPGGRFLFVASPIRLRRILEGSAQASRKFFSSLDLLIQREQTAIEIEYFSL